MGAGDTPFRSRHSGWIAIGFLLLAVAVAWSARQPHLKSFCHDDLRYYTGWAYRMRAFGLGTVYGQHLKLKHGNEEVCLMRGDNPVGQLSIFYVVGRWLYPAVAGAPLSLDKVIEMNRPPDSEEKQTGRWLFKLPAVLADLVTLVILGGWIYRRWGTFHAAVVALLYSLHPALIHNSAMWGQIDVWHSLFMMVGTLLLASGLVVGGVVTLGVALLFKFQAVALVPLAATCLAYAPDFPGWRRPHWGRIGRTAVVLAALLVVAWTPWMVTGAGWHVLDPYDRAVGQYSYATLNTFNLWWLVNDWPDPARIDFFDGINDRELLFRIPGMSWGVSYRLAGILLSFAAAGWTCRELIQKRFSRDAILWSAVAMYLSLFLLATEMHERYLYAAIPLVTLAYQPTLRWWLAFIVIGTATAVNQALFYAPPPGSWLAFATDWLRPDIALAGDVVASTLLALLAFLLFERSIQRLVAGSARTKRMEDRQATRDAPKLAA